MRKILTLLLLGSTSLFAQTTVFKGATIHVGNGRVIENGNLLVANGLIAYCGNGTDGQDRTDVKVIDVTGQHIYPGFIAPNCYVGLNEIDAARATRDFYEVGEIKPNTRSLIAFNTDSKLLPTMRFNGVLMAQVVPQGGMIAGTSSIMNMAGWNWEDAALKPDDAIYLNWHETINPADKEFAEKYTKHLGELTKFLEEAAAYCKLTKPSETNLKFEAMRPVFAGSKKVFVNVNTAKGIAEAIDYLAKHKLKPVIVGGSESYLITDLLKKQDIPVVLMNIHRLPDQPSDAVDLPYRMPSILKAAGIRFCVGIHGSWEVRNLGFQAGTIAGYGLTKEEALAAITANTAEILGIDKLVGTLEQGKQATFFVSKGDALDMQGNLLTYIFVNGKAVAVDGQQQELNTKFQEKYWGK